MSDSHVEEYLKKLNGQDADISFEPQSNVEQYLAKMNGLDVELPPEPESRVEALLADFIESGGGGGGTSAPPKDVNFIDYDGTIVHSYTAAEFAALTVMPDNPTHEGLTAQGWNWSLSDAQSYVASYGFLTIGQMHLTIEHLLYFIFVMALLL